MMDYSKDSLKRLAEIQTPEWKKGMEYKEKMQMFFSYCQVRRNAKYLLNNPNDKEAKKELSELIKKLDIDIE